MFLNNIIVLSVCAAPYTISQVTSQVLKNSSLNCFQKNGTLTPPSWPSISHLKEQS